MARISRRHHTRASITALPRARGTGGPAAPSLRLPRGSTARARLPTAGRTRPPPPRSPPGTRARPRSLPPPRSLAPPGAARRGANIAQPSKPSPERKRSEIPPPALLWERKERGRGERENLCERKRNRPQTFPRVFLEQRGGARGVTEKLVLQRRKRLSP